ncbi:MAG: TIGR02757 family protein [Edaphocola sp.]
MAPNLKELLDGKVSQYNRPQFIANDPISVPHRFTNRQDIEIAGFFAAILAWGNRTGIINSCHRLLQVMDFAPYDFIAGHQPTDLKPLLGFVHRTFNATDLFWLLHFLQNHYRQYPSLEAAFTKGMDCAALDIGTALAGFHDYVFSLPDAPERTRKHVATPAKNSACKRLCMYLRWMVRKDGNGVDFGLWPTIKPAQLICPLDVHTGDVARRMGLLSRKQNDWKAAMALTSQLRLLDAADPTRYDFALFGMGIDERF